MKVRKGFVSNSSSSSFVICKQLMTDEQIKEYSKFVNDIPELDDEGYQTEYYTQESDLYFSGSGEQSDGYQYIDKLREMELHNKIWYGDF